jgi:hypothetical protein
MTVCFPFLCPPPQVSLTFCCKVRRRTFSFIFYVLASGLDSHGQGETAENGASF